MTVKRDKLIQIDDKLYQKCKVHLLPTNKANDSIIGLFRNTLHLHNEKTFDINESDVTKTHIYITSDEEIKEGNWYLSTINKEVKQAIKEDVKQMKQSSEAGFPIDRYKIIATTNNLSGKTIYNEDEHPISDYTLRLPQPSQDFINKYIEKYNKGEQIIDVLVEYMSFQNDRDGIYYNHRVDKNNTITIRPVKDSWSREEHKMNLIYCVSEIAAKLGYASTSKEMKVWNDETNKWIEENL